VKLPEQEMPMRELKGRVWKFEDNVNTDLIAPGQYLDAPIDEVINHTFENIRPEFVKEVHKGDILIAGTNFGCGSSRENAPEALKKVGVECIVAESFARIFFRNAIAIGLPVVICRGVSSSVNDGDIVSVDFREAIVKNVSTGVECQGEVFPDEIQSIIESGGILEKLKSIKA
jgi:3-isopropylmalate dehydratase small subunit